MSGDETLELPGPFALESGGTLPRVRIAYRTWGPPARAATSAVLVCHALTGSADVEAWWPQLLGPGRALDPRRDFVICANVLGGCSGTTGPKDVPPGGNAPYGPDFPALTIRDMVRVQAAMLDALGVRRLALVIGGSLGGLVALEWTLMYPDRVGAAAVLSASARHSAWCIALGEAQRAALAADPRWRDGRYPPDDPPRAGLAAARMMAYCTYRSRDGFEQRFARREGGDAAQFAVQASLRRHGARFVDRFDANTWVTLVRAMDTHDVARGRADTVAAALSRVSAPLFVFGATSDLLYPVSEQEEIARAVPGAELCVLRSPHGHDTFLVDADAVNDRVAAFRERVAARPLADVS